MATTQPDIVDMSDEDSDDTTLGSGCDDNLNGLDISEMSHAHKVIEVVMTDHDERHQFLTKAMVKMMGKHGVETTNMRVYVTEDDPEPGSSEISGTIDIYFDMTDYPTALRYYDLYGHRDSEDYYVNGPCRHRGKLTIKTVHRSYFLHDYPLLDTWAKLNGLRVPRTQKFFRFTNWDRTFFKIPLRYFRERK